MQLLSPGSHLHLRGLVWPVRSGTSSMICPGSPLLRCSGAGQTWGATPAEVAAEMPGDRLLPRAQYRCTRAITIGASPEDVWPWLVQVGCLRGGWYADDLLDNFARPSVRRIVPELQDLRVGQCLAWVPK